MSLVVSSGDLIGSLSLSFSDIAFVTGKVETARLGLAVQLRFFAGHGFFVPDHASIPSDGVLYLAEQLGLDAKSVNHYDFSGRTARRHCAEILRHLGFRRMRSEEHTSELQSLMRISYAVFCLKQKIMKTHEYIQL